MLRNRQSRASGFTVIELLIVLAVFGIVASFALTKFGDVKEDAYIAAMKNDLRNYAPAQEQYFHNQGMGYADSVPQMQRAEDFAFSENVYPDSARGTPDHWFLRVGHEKTDVKCEIDYRRELGLENISNRIECPGGVVGAGEEGNTPPVADFTIQGGLGSSGDVSMSADLGGAESDPEASFQSVPQFYQGSGITLDASPSYDLDGDDLRYDWVLTGTTMIEREGLRVQRIFDGAGEWDLELVVTDTEGAADTARKTLDITDSARFGAWWDACSSYETGTFEDVLGGNHMDIGSDNSTITDWAAEWDTATVGSARKAVVRLDDERDMDMDGSLDFASPTWTLMFLIRGDTDWGSYPRVFRATNPNGTRGGYDNEWAAYNDDLSVVSYSNGKFGPPPAGSWSTIAYRFTGNGDDTQSAEVFVDGVQRNWEDGDGDMYTYSGTVTLSGDVSFASRGSNYYLPSRLSHVLYFEGPLTDSDIQQKHQELMSYECSLLDLGLVLNPDFTYTPERPGEGDEITFDASATEAVNTVVSHEWDFGDGTSAEGKTPAHTYDSAGTYTVELTVVDEDDNVASTTREVVVELDNATLAAEWSACLSMGSQPNQQSEYGGFLEDPVGDFDAQLRSRANSENHPNWSEIWGFDEEGTNRAYMALDSIHEVQAIPQDFDRTARNWAMAFMVRGTEQNFTSPWYTSYKAKLYQGSPDMNFQSEGGEIDAGGNTYGASPFDQWATIVFEVSEIDASNSAVEVFVDGASRGVDTLSTAYVADGGSFLGDDHTNSFEGHLSRIRYYEGGMSPATVQQVHEDLAAQTCTPEQANRAPSADLIRVPELIVAVGEAELDATNSEDPDGDVLAYEWDFGDGETLSMAQGQDYQLHSYDNPGFYTARVIASDPFGARDTAESAVTILPPPQLEHHWDLCSSFKSSTIIDTVAGDNMSVSIPNDATIEDAWTAAHGVGFGGGAGNDTLGIFATGAEVPESDSTATFIWRGRNSGDADGGTIFGTENHWWVFEEPVEQDEIEILYFPNIWQNWRNGFGLTSSQADDLLQWHTVAVRTRMTHDTLQHIEMLVDGVRLDTIYRSNQFIRGGLSNFHVAKNANYSWTDVFRGYVGSGRMYSGWVDDDLLMDAHSTLMDEFGCEGVDLSIGPDADFTYSPDPGQVGGQITFDGTASNDDNGDPLSYAWDFDEDGVDDATGPYPTRTYSEGGYHPVRLIATEGTAEARADTITKNVLVGAPAQRVAHWDPCTSQGAATFTDVENGVDLAFESRNGTVSDWSTFWESSPAAFKATGETNRIWATGGDVDAPAYDWTLFFQVRRDFTDTGDYSQTANIAEVVNPDGHNFKIAIRDTRVLYPGGNWRASDGVPSFNAGWRNLAVRATRPAVGEPQAFDLFIDGTKIGETKFGDADRNYAVNGEMRLFSTSWWEGYFDGALGHVIAYEGEMSDSQITSLQGEMSGWDCSGGTPSTSHAPVADFEWAPSQPSGGDAVTFDGTLSYDSDGSISSYSWSFPGGVSYSGSAPSHTFSSAGSHQVTLTVTDDDGLTDSVTKTISVYAEAASMVCMGNIPFRYDSDPERAYRLWVDDDDPSDFTIYTASWRTAASRIWNSTPDVFVSGSNGALSWESQGAGGSGSGDPSDAYSDGTSYDNHDTFAITMPSVSPPWSSNYYVDVQGDTGGFMSQVAFNCSEDQIHLDLTLSDTRLTTSESGTFTATAEQRPGVQIDNLSVSFIAPDGSGSASASCTAASGSAPLSCSGSLPASAEGVWTVKADASGANLSSATTQKIYEVVGSTSSSYSCSASVQNTNTGVENYLDLTTSTSNPSALSATVDNVSSEVLPISGSASASGWTLRDLGGSPVQSGFGDPSDLDTDVGYSIEFQMPDPPNTTDPWSKEYLISTSPSGDDDYGYRVTFSCSP